MDIQNNGKMGRSDMDVCFMGLEIQDAGYWRSQLWREKSFVAFEKYGERGRS